MTLVERRGLTVRYQYCLWTMLFALLLIVTACVSDKNGPGPMGPQDEVAAKVNEEEIPMLKFQVYLEQEKAYYSQKGFDFENNEKDLNNLKQGIIDRLINTTLILQAARKSGYEPAEEEVEASFEELMAQLGDEQELDKLLQRYRYTEEDLREEIRNELLLIDYLDQLSAGLSVSKTEIEEAYIEQKRRFEESADPPAGAERAHAFPPLDLVKEEIREQLLEEKRQQETLNKVKQLRQKSKIEVFV